MQTQLTATDLLAKAEALLAKLAALDAAYEALEADLQDSINQMTAEIAVLDRILED